MRLLDECIDHGLGLFAANVSDNIERFLGAGGNPPIFDNMPWMDEWLRSKRRPIESAVKSRRSDLAFGEMAA